MVDVKMLSVEEQAVNLIVSFLGAPPHDRLRQIDGQLEEMGIEDWKERDVVFKGLLGKVLPGQAQIALQLMRSLGPGQLSLVPRMFGEGPAPPSGGNNDT